MICCRLFFRRARIFGQTQCYMHACWINKTLYNMNHCWSAMRCWESMRERKPLRWVANEQPRTASCTLQLNWNTTAEVCRTENKCNIEDNCRVVLLLLTVLLNSEQKPGVEMKAVSNNLHLKNVKALTEAKLKYNYWSVACTVDVAD